MNRLASATSPYLLQHKDNPVDWWEWSDDAFTSARERDVPILLSVGYAACHWCHVMGHESFENTDIAALMNEHFVCVKVDREERPDVDAVYMSATTTLTGQGGWPMTCLLTAAGEPFYAGTYFPPRQFVALLRSVATAWRDNRDEVLAAGQRVVAALAAVEEQTYGDVVAGAATPGEAEIDAAARRLAAGFDERHGGFGGAPKFPPSMALEFLLRHHERTGDAASLAICERTLEAMARGGIYDQLAGGFARYAVDAAWVVPHFEKMLYDNALLLRLYTHWFRRSGSPLAERVARETADFLLRDLLTAEGGFASALDADTDGVEGATYVWTPGQLAETLGADADAAARLFSVTPEGTFEKGASTLQLRADPPDHSAWSDVRARLLAARTARAQPQRDDKVVTAWNGLAIAALAEAGVALANPNLVAAAERCGDLLARLHVVDGRLRRASRDGVAGAAAAVAEDYGNVSDGFLVLHQVTANARWLEAARDLLDTALERFADGPDAVRGFFDTADDAEQLVRRPRDPTDNATPSGASALATALLAYSALTGSTRHRTAAERTVASASALAIAQPRFFGQLLGVAVGLVSGPLQVAVVGEPGGDALTELAWRLRPPGAVVVSGEPDAPGVPLLAGRPLVSGRPAAYVCRGMVCDLPATDDVGLASALLAG